MRRIRHGCIRGIIAFVVISSANRPTSFPADFGDIVDHHRRKKSFVAFYCSSKREPHPHRGYTRSRTGMWYESALSPPFETVTHCVSGPDSGTQQDSGISPWSASLPTIGTSGSLGSTRPSSQPHKHRRMSSLGQSRRRISDAREATTRPSCV